MKKIWSITLSTFLDKKLFHLVSFFGARYLLFRTKDYDYFLVYRLDSFHRTTL